MADQAVPHSPLPWAIRGGEICYGDPRNDMQVCEIGDGGPGLPDARYIVTAANAHHVLVDALEALWLWASEQRIHLTTEPVPDGLSATVQAALAKADHQTGEGQ